MSHLSEILDRQSWLTTAAIDISQILPAQIERQRKRLEREAVEQKERARGSVDAANATMSFAPTIVFARDDTLPDVIRD